MSAATASVGVFSHINNSFKKIRKSPKLIWKYALKNENKKEIKCGYIDSKNEVFEKECDLAEEPKEWFDKFHENSLILSWWILVKRELIRNKYRITPEQWIRKIPKERQLEVEFKKVKENSNWESYCSWDSKSTIWEGIKCTFK